MTKPVTPQEMFDLWQKMVNPGAYPLQSLMFPVLDPEELERKIAELETVEHWLRANLSMLQLTIRSLEFQKGMLEGGGKAAKTLPGEGAAGEMPNPALWAWNMMAEAARAQQPPEPDQSRRPASKPKRKRK